MGDCNGEGQRVNVHKAINISGVKGNTVGYPGNDTG